MSVINPKVTGAMTTFMGLGNAGNAAVVDSESIFGNRDDMEFATAVNDAIKEGKDLAGEGSSLMSPHSLIEVNGNFFGHVDTSGQFHGANGLEFNQSFYDSVEVEKGETYEDAVARSIADMFGGEVVNPQDRLREGSKGMPLSEGLTEVDSWSVDPNPYDPNAGAQPIFMQQDHSKTLFDFQAESQKNDEEKGQSGSGDPVMDLVRDDPKQVEANEQTAEDDFMAYQDRTIEEKVGDAMDDNEEKDAEKATEGAQQAREDRQERGADQHAQQHDAEQSSLRQSEAEVAESLGITTAEEEMRMAMFRGRDSQTTGVQSGATPIPVARPTPTPAANPSSSFM